MNVPLFYLANILKQQTRVYKPKIQKHGCIFAQSGIGGQTKVVHLILMVWISCVNEYISLHVNVHLTPHTCGDWSWQ